MSSDTLLTLLQPDETDYTGAAALEDGDVHAISGLAQGPDLRLAKKAVFLAGLVNAESAIRIVTFAAASHVAGLRIAAAATARHLPDGAAEGILPDLATDPDVAVRKAAIESAGAVATPQMRLLLDRVAVRDPLDPLRDLARSVAQRVGSGVLSDYQRRIDAVTRRAKRRPYAEARAQTLLTDDDVAFLNDFYGAIALAGRLIAPEASQLLRRYLDPTTRGVEVVNSEIYERSPRVQAEMKWHRARIAAVAAAGRLPAIGAPAGFPVNGEAKRHESCNAPRGAPAPTRMITAEQADERLQKANNRFYLQSYSFQFPEGGSVRTRFVVTDCYRFEPFARGLYTNFDVLGLRLRVEDGLGEYLTRIGEARTFTYESSWSRDWQP